MKKRLHHIDLLVKDIAQARRFFEEVMGFEISPNPVHARAGSFEALVPAESVVRFEVHELTDEYRESHAAQLQYGAPDVDHIGIAVEDVDRAYQELSAAGVEFKSAPHTNSVGRRIARASDLEGNGWIQLVGADDD